MINIFLVIYVNRQIDQMVYLIYNLTLKLIITHIY